ncbi:MAG TPA: 50S ribosomal protein L29 [bacterium]|nr:50S ribosomal protein L29 [bacterium]HPL95886.1 50S ribosomal protein L29 [bacterium]
MKKNFSELKLKSDAELKTALNNAGRDYQTMRFKISQKQLKNIRQIRQIKKNIARLKTALKLTNQNN